MAATYPEGTEPSWVPTETAIANANITALASSLGLGGFDELYSWSIDDRAGYWDAMIRRLGIVFDREPERILDDSGGAAHATWLAGATLNIVNSCFTGDEGAVAIRHTAGGEIVDVSYAELRNQVSRVAHGLRSLGYGLGSRIAIAMPMTIEAVCAYLGIVSIGGAVVSIADSFAPDEIATRLAITGADTVITGEVIERSGRRLPMYAKVAAAGAHRAIVVDAAAGVARRREDLTWDALLAAGEGGPFEPVATDPHHHINYLFSSGTTGDPKAIPWSQLTPIKAAADGMLHQDIHADDVVAWPTNLGWMMGPWLIFASLLNGATMALHDDAPTTPSFVEFVERAAVSVLGVVPSIVAAWRTGGMLDRADWSELRVLSSTGEASNPDDMAWLMTRTSAPVIEYCGGTEIGGGYISGTVVQPQIAGAFSTPTFGMGMTILDEDGAEADTGEVFLVPPSIGLSTELLNRNHDEVYYDGVPTHPQQLRRHGDQMQHLGHGYYRALGRVDDTMNLGGIKVSSAEIERALDGVPGVAEVAAVAAAPPGGGPSRLVVFAVAEPGFTETASWLPAMREAVRTKLNPLFKIHDVVAIDALPRTASAKVMRRHLRSDYADRQDAGRS